MPISILEQTPVSRLLDMTRLPLSRLCAFWIVVALSGVAVPNETSAQTCAAPPQAPTDVTPTVSAGTELTPALVTLVWAGLPTTGTAAVTSYVVEVGTAPALVDVASIDTGNTEPVWEQPATIGTYYVRIRSRNACGLSDPSPEVEIFVTTGIPSGQPAVRPIASTLGYSQSSSGNLIVTGEARSAWGSRAATFVRMTVRVLDSARELLGTDFSYVEGRPRRIQTTRTVVNNSLAGAETACFSIVTTVPAPRASSVTVSATYDNYPTEELRSRVDLPGRLITERTSVGHVRAVGDARNAGPGMTYFNKVVLEVRNAANDVIDCDFAYVTGSTYRFPTGSSTDTALGPGQVGSFVASMRAEHSRMQRVMTHTQFDEPDSASTLTSSRADTLLRQLREVQALPVVVRAREEYQRVRNALYEELRAMAASGPISSR